MITFDDFLKVELRVGRIVEARGFPEARKPVFILHIDLGRKSACGSPVRKSPRSTAPMSLPVGWSSP
jgi:tRNA-binding EMAP/Myf-like protein